MKKRWIACLLMAGMLSIAAPSCVLAQNAQVADAGEMAEAEEVTQDWMVPITAENVAEGVYPVEVKSSSPMFKIVDCSLTVENGEMTAVMTMSGTGYLYLFMGTGMEAVEASEEEYIPFVENAEGKHTYTVPVEALDAAIDCTAFSKKKEKWYDRKLCFLSTSLPSDAILNSSAVTAESLDLADGTYTVDVTLSGGSGRASVESPAVLTVEGGEMTAQIVFSSANYDYMLVGEERYDRINTEGNSAFEIPVEGFDKNLPVVADTTAMSVPYEIDYTLLFDSASIEKAE